MQALSLNDAPTGADTPFVQFWNDVLAPKFIRFRHVLVDGLSQHSDAVFPELPVTPGDRILDVGCGFGDTAMRLGQLTGPNGSVVGVDCCDAFLDHARADVRARQIANVSFARGDAELMLPTDQFDFVFARFGTMFFANPVAGLRNMRKALHPGGQMVHIVWRERKDNPWLSMAKDIVLEYLPAPGDDALTCGPGPFSMSGEETVRAMMASAGYTNISFRRVDAPVMIGRTVKEAIEFQLSIGPAGEVFREAGPLAEKLRPQIEAALSACDKPSDTIRQRHCDAQLFLGNYRDQSVGLRSLNSRANCGGHHGIEWKRQDRGLIRNCP